MLHRTRGIVLRSVKYGDTSLILSIYTELFGLQSYLVKGVRTESKKVTKANLYQPTTLLDLVVYHQPHKNLQRIKEAKLDYIYKTLQTDVVKNSVAVFFVELLQKSISQPEPNVSLYNFIHTTCMAIDQKEKDVISNLPILMCAELSEHLGFSIRLNYSQVMNHFDLQSGSFISSSDAKHLQIIPPPLSSLFFQIISSEPTLKIDNETRSQILLHCINYLKIHLPDMPTLRSVDVLHAVLND